MNVFCLPWAELFQISNGQQNSPHQTCIWIVLIYLHKLNEYQPPNSMTSIFGEFYSLKNPLDILMWHSMDGWKIITVLSIFDSRLNHFDSLPFLATIFNYIQLNDNALNQMEKRYFMGKIDKNESRWWLFDKNFSHK